MNEPGIADLDNAPSSGFACLNQELPVTFILNSAVGARQSSIKFLMLSQ